MDRFPQLGRLSDIANLEQMQQLLRSHRVAVLFTVGTAVLLPFAIKDYRAYISYGPGGLPYNAFGWLLTNSFRLFAREQLSPTPYNDKKLPFAEEPGYLPEDFPPKRNSPRPRLGTHPVPQRQLDQLPSEGVRRQLIDGFEQLGKQAEQKGLVEVKPSLYERRHEALFVSSARPQHVVAQQTRGEISHVHAGLDGSIHVMLHPADCIKVFERGWGQRHAFSGSPGVGIPVNYLLIYAPRDQAEIDIVLDIVKAGIQFMARTREPLK